MPIYNDIFSINQVYELMVDGEWVSSPYVRDSTASWFGGGYAGTTLSTIDRVVFATDTSTASYRSDFKLPDGISQQPETYQMVGSEGEEPPESFIHQLTD